MSVCACNLKFEEAHTGRHLDKGVALCKGHAILLSCNSFYEALQARGVGSLLGGWWARLKGEVLCQAGSVYAGGVLL